GADESGRTARSADSRRADQAGPEAALDRLGRRSAPRAGRDGVRRSPGAGHGLNGARCVFYAANGGFPSSIPDSAAKPSGQSAAARSIEAEEAAELGQFGARRAESVRRMVAVAVAD